jgi:hypothetical protein
VRVGEIFVTERAAVTGPPWILNFPTKQHWRSASKMEWVSAGLADLRRVITEKGIRSVAVPPLGTGQGGLEWSRVKQAILSELEGLADVEILVYEPTSRYQNVAKRSGVEKLTPGRALIAELVRRYWVLGIEKRLADASPSDMIWFDDARADRLAAYLKSSEMRPYQAALERTTRLIDGFESPLGMELLATVDWLLHRDGLEPSLPSIKAGLRRWPGGESGSRRKLRIFDDRLLTLALERLDYHSRGFQLRNR